MRGARVQQRLLPSATSMPIMLDFIFFPQVYSQIRSTERLRKTEFQRGAQRALAVRHPHGHRPSAHSVVRRAC